VSWMPVFSRLGDIKEFLTFGNTRLSERTGHRMGRGKKNGYRHQKIVGRCTRDHGRNCRGKTRTQRQKKAQNCGSVSSFREGEKRLAAGIPGHRKKINEPVWNWQTYDERGSTETDTGKNVFHIRKREGGTLKRSSEPQEGKAKKNHPNRLAPCKKDKETAAGFSRMGKRGESEQAAGRKRKNCPRKKCYLETLSFSRAILLRGKGQGEEKTGTQRARGEK